MSLGMELGLGPGHFLLDWDPAPLPKIFGPCLLWSTAGWMKLVLGMEVGLSPGDFVLDGNLALPTQKGGGASSPIFGQFLL